MSGTDAVDFRILGLLQENSALSLGDIAASVNLSQNACWRRIRRLEEAGIIKKRVALLDAAKLGVGTTVRLRLPLSMAITRVMTVDVGGQLYGIPMDLVVETVRIPRDRLRQIKSMEAIVLREAVLPVVRLRGLLAMAPRPAEEEAVLVLRIAGAPLGIIVDEFRTGMDVILKPFAGILANMTGYAGTAVLGDGKVLLILNLKEML